MFYTWCIKVVGIRLGSQLWFLYFWVARKGFFSLVVFHMSGPCLGGFEILRDTHILAPHLRSRPAFEGLLGFTMA